MPHYCQKPILTLMVASGVGATLLGPGICSSHQLSIPQLLVALCRPGALPISHHYRARDAFCQLLSQGKDTTVKPKYLRERAGYASPFSKAQRCGISYLQAKSNTYFEEKKKKNHWEPNISDKNSSKASHKGPWTTMGSKHLGRDPSMQAGCTLLLPWCWLQLQRLSVFF